MRRIIFYSIFIFIFSIGVGYYYASLWKSNNISSLEQNEIPLENMATETVSTEEKISYDANLTLKKYYNECGHYKENDVEIPIELINMSKEELENSFSDWTVEQFSSNDIVLAQHIDSICDDHYVLKLGSNDNIEIYHINENKGLELYRSTNISKEYLTGEDITTLEDGIFVYGSSSLNSAIEDFE